MLLSPRKATLAALFACFLFAQMGSLAPCSAQTPTYAKDVLPVLQKHCISCHHKGGAAPQSFEDYRSMRPWIKSTKKTISEKSMPPWHADPAIGKWKNDGSLSDAEAKTISAWVDGKAPEGDAAAAPPALDFSKPWRLGEPGKTLAAEAFKLPAEGGDLYKAFILPGDFPEDAWMEAIELAPGATEPVMQMALSAVPAAQAKADFPLHDRPMAEGARPFLAVWNKGMSLLEAAPAGTGILIPKGSALILQVHYKTNGEAAEIQSKVGLHPAKGAPAKPLMAAFVEAREFEIPANSFDHKVAGELKLEKGAKIYSILPRMHYLGKGIEIVAAKPDGSKQSLLKVTDYSYELQTLYTPAEPIALPAGTTITASAAFNNSKDNPNNPNAAVKNAKPGPAPAGEIMSVVLQYAAE